MPIERVGEIPMNGFPMNERRELTLSGRPLIDLIQAVLERGASLKIQVRGCSMSPCIKNGDMVVLSALPGRSPRLGDVVASRLPGCDRVLIHRVAGKIGDLHLIRGDNCAEADGLVSQRVILGRVCRVERNGIPVRFGLGPERRVLAILSRSSHLIALYGLIRRVSGFCGIRVRERALAQMETSR